MRPLFSDVGDMAADLNLRAPFGGGRLDWAWNSSGMTTTTQVDSDLPGFLRDMGACRARAYKGTGYFLYLFFAMITYYDTLTHSRRCSCPWFVRLNHHGACHERIIRDGAIMDRDEESHAAWGSRCGENAEFASASAAWSLGIFQEAFSISILDAH